MASSNLDHEALVKSILSRLERGPKDVALHTSVLAVCFQYKLIKHAYDHIYNLEFIWKAFTNNYDWYEMLNELFKSVCHNTKDWLFQLLLLVVKQRMCMLSISDVPSATSKSLTETSELLHAYDQAVEFVARTGAHGEFHASLVQHHRAQIAFHAALLLLKKAKNIEIDWNVATKFATPLMLNAWQNILLVQSPRTGTSKQDIALIHWDHEEILRRFQAGYYLLKNIQLINNIFIEGSPCFSDTNWREELFKTLFTSESHFDQIKTSYLRSDALEAPVLRFPRKDEIQAYEDVVLGEYGNSLHHLVWILMTYENYAHFEFKIFDKFTDDEYIVDLNKLDFYAFLYCAVFTARQKNLTGLTADRARPILLPVNITDLLFSQAQAEWWDYAYELSYSSWAFGSTEDRTLLIRGRDAVRCIGEHGLDPELLCTLGRIFSDRSKLDVNEEFKLHLEKRAALYYATAIPLLKKLKSKMPVEIPENRLFDYTHNTLSTEQLNGLLEECRRFVAYYNVNDGEHDKDNEILSHNKSPQDYYQTQDDKKIGTDENSSSSDVESKAKFAALLCKARSFALKALDTLGDSNSEGLHSDTKQIIEDIKKCLNKLDPELSTLKDVDDDASTGCNSNINNSTINDFMEQTIKLFEENRKQIITVDSNVQNTIEKLKHLNIDRLCKSVDYVKDQIDECRNECKDVGEIKKQIVLLTEQVSKLEKAGDAFRSNKNSATSMPSTFEANMTSPAVFAAPAPAQTPTKLKTSDTEFQPNVEFKPEVEDVTGCYQLVSGAWKERGKGVVKILQHKDTGKLRVVMRRDQVFKICLNHVLSPEIAYSPKDETTWIFAANDYSEGELNLKTLCLKFSSKDNAMEFKRAVDKARKGDLDGANNKHDTEKADLKNNAFNFFYFFFLVMASLFAYASFAASSTSMTNY